jgi:hypothetical protein
MAPRKNFTPEEDLFLCKAYVNATDNSIKGTDQKGDDFWDSVVDAFKPLLKPGSDRARDPKLRSSLWNRFKRKIQKDCILYNGIRKTLRVQSGESDEDFVKRAKEEFERRNNRPFNFLHCLDTLAAMPLFSNENTEESSSSGGEGGAANDTVYSGTPHDRPKGQHAAKREVKEAMSKEWYQDKKIKVLHGLGTAMEKVASLSKLLATSVKEANDKEYYFNLAKIYSSMNQTDLAMQALDALKAFAPKAVGETEDEDNSARQSNAVPGAIEVNGADSGSMSSDEDGM